VEEMTKIEHQAEYATKERAQATENATKLEQQIIVVNKEKQKVLCFSSVISCATY